MRSIKAFFVAANYDGGWTDLLGPEIRGFFLGHIFARFSVGKVGNKFFAVE